MLDGKALANSLAVVVFLVYVVCVGLSMVAPELLFNYATLLIHSLNLTPLKSNSAQIGITQLILGAILITGSTWIVMLSVSELYNRMRSK